MVQFHLAIRYMSLKIDKDLIEKEMFPYKIYMLKVKKNLINVNRLEKR